MWCSPANCCHSMQSTRSRSISAYTFIAIHSRIHRYILLRFFALASVSYDLLVLPSHTTFFTTSTFVFILLGTIVKTTLHCLQLFTCPTHCDSFKIHFMKCNKTQSIFKPSVDIDELHAKCNRLTNALSKLFCNSSVLCASSFQSHGFLPGERQQNRK